MRNDLEKDLYQPVMDVLGPEMGAHWRARTRPAFALSAGFASVPVKDDALVVGHVGGLPALPPDMPWPTRQGYGPMDHLATIDCAALPRGVLDIDLPEDGTLLFFRWDTGMDRYRQERNFVLSQEEEDNLFISPGLSGDQGAGIKLIHIPSSTVTEPRPHPYPDDEFYSSSECEFASLHLVGTFASRLCWERTEEEYPLSQEQRDALAEAFDTWKGDEYFEVQIGGHQDPVQGPTLADTIGDPLHGPHQEQVREGAMTVLATIYDPSDIHTYWFIEPGHLTQRRFDQIYYDHQR